MKWGSEMGFAVCPSVPSAHRLLNAVLMKGRQAIKMHVHAKESRSCVASEAVSDFSKPIAASRTRRTQSDGFGWMGEK